MIKLLQCEFKKTRRRSIFITALIITAAELVWLLYGNYNDFIIENGWMAFLYELPLANTIFMPILSIIVSSRMCDIEHKGAMLKLLSSVAEKGRIYDAKLFYGLSIVLFCNILSLGAEIIFGCIKGFGGSVPIRLYLLQLLFTLTPTVGIYVFQHTLSLLFKNQAIAFFTGIIGTFCGLFSMFLPWPWLRRIFLWGYYGALQFVGLFGWEKETRYANAYYAVTDIDWLSFGILVAACAAMYIAGRILFCRKDV